MSAEDRDHRRRRAAGQLPLRAGGRAGPRRRCLHVEAVGHHRPGRRRADHRARRRGDQLRGVHQRRRRRKRRGRRVRGQRHRPRTSRAGLRARRRPADPRLHRLRVLRHLHRGIGGCRSAPLRAQRPHRPARRLRVHQVRRRAGRPGRAAGRGQWFAPPGSTPAAPARTSSPSCSGWPPARARWTWSTTRSGRPPTSPTWPAALLQIADDRVRGPVLHAANEGAVIRFEQARAVFEECGGDPARVRPVRTDQFPRPAPRPTYSALGSRESAAAGLTPLRPWRAALVAALAAAGAGTAAAGPLPSTR